MDKSLVWILVGMLAGMLIMYGFIGKPYMEAHAALEYCESALPRDQHCIITAVIEESGE